MCKKQGGNAFVGLLLVLLCVGGWVANIVHLVKAEHIAGMEIARIAGIFVAPLGVVLGYF